MTISLSVIICSHNPRPDYLARVLAALQAQTLPLSEWELLLIDNASNEPLADRFDLRWHPNARHVREEELGLTPARLRGIAEAKGNLLVFVDDDNVLASNYLQNALQIGLEWPMLGAWGGGTRGVFEIPPPAWIEDYLGHLAIRSCERILWSNSPKDWEARPFGAGICVRASVAHDFADSIGRDPLARLLGRRGEILSAQEDTKICFCSIDRGLGIGLFPQLQLDHLIPKQRMTVGYIDRMMREGGASQVLLSSVCGSSTPSRVSRSPRYWLRLLRFVLCGQMYRARFEVSRQIGIVRGNRLLKQSR